MSVGPAHIIKLLSEADALPCPFCSSDNIVTTYIKDADQTVAQCMTCNCSGPPPDHLVEFYDEEAGGVHLAIQAWNRRLPPTRVNEVSKALSKVSIAHEERKRIKEAFRARIREDLESAARIEDDVQREVAIRIQNQRLQDLDWLDYI